MLADDSGQQKPRPRATFEDFLRAIAYLGFLAWAVVFLIFPPVSYEDALDFWTRLVWLGITAFGAALAAVGAARRIDLKMELPGLIFMLIGPLLYVAAQVYYLSHPSADPYSSARQVLATYTLLPILLLLPRIWGLYTEARRLKKAHAANRMKLTPHQEAQPGAFKIQLKGK